MNHEMFLAKLHFCGIQGVSEDWFRSSVTNTRQKVASKMTYFNSKFFFWLGYIETWDFYKDQF